MENARVEQSESPPEPPKPPEIQRELKFYRAQAVGMSLIAVLPILGLARVFDFAPEHQSASSNALELRVDYPSRMRSLLDRPLTIQVRNRTANGLNEIELSVSRSLLSSQRTVQFRPEPDKVTDESFTFELGPLSPGEVETVEIEFEAGEPGSHSGTIKASSASDAVELPLATYVFP